MTNANAASANEEAMPKTHRHYEFGTFQERLDHLCALFETEPPEIIYEDGQPTVGDDLLAWCRKYEINLDWFLVGSPCSLVRYWSERHLQEREIVEVVGGLEPEVAEAFTAMMWAVASHRLPVEAAQAEFTKVMKEYRAGPKVA